MKNNRIKKPKKKNIYEEEKEEFWRMNCEEEEPSGGITRSKDKESKYRRKLWKEICTIAIFYESFAIIAQTHWQFETHV